jgi:hypothetical protein
MSTSKSFHFIPLLFSSSDSEKKFSFLVTIYFGFLHFPPTLVDHPLFFDIGWLNSSFGQNHNRVSQIWRIKVSFQNPFLVKLKTSFKYEYLDDIESSIFFHFQFQIMML